MKLTKSLYMKGWQCPRLLWLAARKLLPEPSLADKMKMEQGGIFEEYAHKLFPEGINLAGMEYKENLEKTKQSIKEKKTIFEAGIEFDDLFLRADVLQPDKDGWNLIEIKASTKVKPEHIPDLAFQKYVCEKAGLKINRTFVIILNKEFIKDGEIDPKELSTIEEVTEKVNLVDDIEKNTKLFLKIMNQKTEPDMIISMQCGKPRECALKQECWGTLPENNVLQFTNWRMYWKLLEQGITDIKDTPEDIPLKPKDEVIFESVTKNRVYVSKEHIKHFLNSLHYPLYHLDFETFDTAVPIFDKSRPWQKIPFQYSLHIEQADGKTDHFEFLAEDGKDPRPGLLKNLKEQMKGEGSVIVFNKSFEVGRLQELMTDFPEHKDWIQDVLDRIVDLAIPFQNYHYYNPSQKGKYSIKKVLPAITGKSYDNLDISGGGEASAQYFYSHIEHKLKNKEEIRKNLLKYCCLDTEGMIWIINKLKRLAGGK